jgi:hypothetical protein
MARDAVLIKDGRDVLGERRHVPVGVSGLLLRGYECQRRDERNSTGGRENSVGHNSPSYCRLPAMIQRVVICCMNSENRQYDANQ